MEWYAFTRSAEINCTSDTGCAEIGVRMKDALYLADSKIGHFDPQLAN